MLIFQYIAVAFEHCTEKDMELLMNIFMLKTELMSRGACEKLFTVLKENGKGKKFIKFCCSAVLKQLKLDKASGTTKKPQ